MLRWNAFAVPSVLMVLGACQSSGVVPTEVAVDTEVGVNVRADALVLRTEDVTVEAGKERFLCFATTLQEDAVISGYTHEAQAFVHHVVFVRTTSKEPDGVSECNVLFRPSWDPLFLSGAGRSELLFPSGVGHKLTKGTQLLAQLHLLNSGTKDVHGPVDIIMHRSTATAPEPVGAYVFGTTDLHLPAGQRSEVQAMCELTESVQLIAAFPHMHLLGTGLRFEVGSSAGAMRPVFTREPYDFDDQHVEPLKLTLEPGDVTRVTCDYDNDSVHEVTFGESTQNEMCFFVGFAVGREKLSTCLQRSAADPPATEPVPVDPAAGTCGEHEPNARGIGKSCTAGGGECADGLMCTSDLRKSDAVGLCIAVGCSSQSECGGGGATCCAAQPGVNICIAEACRTPSCIPVQ